MAIKKFNSVAGFSVGNGTPVEVIDDTGNVSANNLTANSKVNFTNSSNVSSGSLANIHISGGTSGYVISTDGTGNLFWENPADVGTAGSNTEVQFNNDGLFGASSDFTFDSANVVLTVNGTVDAQTVSSTTFVASSSNIAVNVNTVIDTFPIDQYRTAKYVIRASNDLGYESMEALLIHDGTDSYLTVYGAISTLSEDILVADTTIDGSGHVKLLASGIAANTVVNLVKTYITD